MASEPRGNRISAPIPNPQSPIPSAVGLDAAIDIVAREMTALDARADLRARVLARIDAAPSKAGWRQTPAWAAAIAVMVLAVVLWGWLTPTREPAQQHAATATLPAPPSATDTRGRTDMPADSTADSTAASAASHATASQVFVSDTQRGRTGPGQTVSADAVVDGAAEAESPDVDAEPWVVVELLPEPRPIAIAPLSTMPVEITSLNITEIRIDPVDPGRNPDRQ